MTNMITTLSTHVRALTVAGVVAAALAAPAMAAESGTHIERHKWTFGGFFGQFDNAQLQRGFQVYKEVCANCHGLNRIAFRNLSEPGGPQFPAAAVAALAATYKVKDGPNDEGKMFERPAKPADRIPPPYANEQEARSIHNGAYPPDLSLMAKARNVETVAPWYIHPALMLKDIAMGYQEGGADYLRALLVSYGEPPAYVNQNGHYVPLKEGDNNPKAERCVSITPGTDGKPDVCNKLLDGMQYNAAFPGGQIAMPPPLNDGQVTYTDGTPAKVENYAADVSAFLAWTADPTLEARKKLGWQVMLYLVIMSILLYIGKKRIWSKIPH